MSKATAAAAAAAAAAPEVVRATREGFYGSARIRVGKTFQLSDPKHFSAKWMVRVPSTTPIDVADASRPSPQALRRRGQVVDNGTPRALSQIAKGKPLATDSDSDSVI